jgi:predicted TIM-barrel fold metal-dependent hydrolase
MITDSHSHLGSIHDHEAVEFWKTHKRIPDRVVESFFQVRQWVDRSIVVAFPGGPHISSNDCIAQFAQEHSDKVAPFYLIDPQAESCLDDIQLAFDEWSAKGVKLAPIYQHFKPDDEQYFPVYEKLEKLGLAIIWFQGSSGEAPDGPLEWANPVLLDKVARTFPDLKMVIAHLGLPWFHETVAMIKKHPNLYTDISAIGARTWVLYSALVEAVQYDTEEKVLFGSEYPMYTPGQIRDSLQEAVSIPEGTHLPQLPSDIVDRMLSRDSFQMLGIDQ